VWAVLALLMILLLLVRMRAQLRRRRLGIAAPIRLPWLTAVLVVGTVALWLTAPVISIPPQFYLMLPYIAAIAVLAGLAGRSRAPAALAEPLPARA
jgi:ABC-type uncharacterized transport system permease subunit